MIYKILNLIFKVVKGIVKDDFILRDFTFKLKTKANFSIIKSNNDEVFTYSFQEFSFT